MHVAKILNLMKHLSISRDTMSVIAVRKAKDHIEIACDTQTTYGRNKYAKDSGMYKDSAKVHKLGDTVFGFAGTVYAANMFRVFAKTHVIAYAEEEQILDHLVEFVEWAKKRDANFVFENDIIVIHDKKVFLCNALDVMEVDKFNAIGSGSFLAIGAMAIGATAKEAVEVACKYDLYCSGETIDLQIPL